MPQVGLGCWKIGKD
jgi:D-xylose reductase